jgi:hypothetical protein
LLELDTQPENLSADRFSPGGWRAPLSIAACKLRDRDSAIAGHVKRPLARDVPAIVANLPGDTEVQNVNCRPAGDVAVRVA